ncbi:MAG: hypothetical protein V1838_05540 [Patescibacteria group bacterium]
MKRVILITIIAFLLLPYPTTSGAYQISPELQAGLVKYQYDPFIGPLVQQVQSKLPQYEALIDQAIKCGSGKEISIILQMHDIMTDDPVLLTAAAESQKVVKSYLDAQAYDIIAGEGYDCDPLTHENVVNMAITELKKDGMLVTREQMEEGFKNSLIYDAVLQYCVVHPEAIIIGFEDMALNKLNDKALSTEQFRSPLELYQYRQLTDRLSELRSHVALAKLVLKLDKIGKQRGAMVIGYLHKDHFPPIKGLFGVKMNFLDATPIKP